MRRTTGGLSRYESPDNDSSMKKSIRFITNGTITTGPDLHIPIITSQFESISEAGNFGRPHKSCDPPHMFILLCLVCIDLEYQRWRRAPSVIVTSRYLAYFDPGQRSQELLCTCKTLSIASAMLSLKDGYHWSHANHE